MTFSESMEYEHSSIYDLACSLLFWLFLALGRELFQVFSLSSSCVWAIHGKRDGYFANFKLSTRTKGLTRAACSGEINTGLMGGRGRGPLSRGDQMYLCHCGNVTKSEVPLATFDLPANFVKAGWTIAIQSKAITNDQKFLWANNSFQQKFKK